MPASHVLACRTLVLLLPASLLLWSGSAGADDTADDTPAGPAATTSVHTAGTQQVRLQALPQVVQQGPRAAPAAWAKAAITATVRPVLAGRPVRLQVQRGLSWRYVDRVKQDRAGRAQFAAPVSVDGQPLTYRVKALRFGGLEGVVSEPVSTERWLAPTWGDEFAGTVLGPSWSHRGQSYEPQSLRRCSKGDPQRGPGAQRCRAAERPQGPQQDGQVPGRGARPARPPVRLPPPGPHRHPGRLRLPVRRRRGTRQVPPLAWAARQPSGCSRSEACTRAAPGTRSTSSSTSATSTPWAAWARSSTATRATRWSRPALG